MQNKTLSCVLQILSLLCVILAVIGAFGYDLWLASTQWVLVAVLLAVWGNYVRPCLNEDNQSEER